MDNSLQQPFCIPQLDGGGYDDDEDYAAAEEEEISSSSVSEFSVASESGSGEEEIDVSTIPSKNLTKTALKPKYNDIVDIPSRRVTRQQGLKKPVGRPRGLRRIPIPAKQEESTRPVRGVVNQDNKIEAREDNNKFLCKNCKKGFSTKTSLGSHIYWCDPLRITRSRTGDARKQDKSSNKTAHKNKSSKSKEAQKIVQASVTGTKQQKNDKANKSQSHEPHTKDENAQQVQNKLRNLSETEAEILPEPENQADSTDESDYETRFTFPSQALSNEMEQTIISHEQEQKTNETSATCPKCKMTYRNIESLQKHIDICAYTSSSCSSSSEDEDLDEDKTQTIGKPQGYSQNLQESPLPCTDIVNEPGSGNPLLKNDSILHSLELVRVSLPEALSSIHSNIQDEVVSVKTPPLLAQHVPFNNQVIDDQTNNVICPTFTQENQITNTPSVTSGYTITEANNSEITKLTNSMAYPQKYHHTEPHSSVYLKQPVPNTAVTNTVNSVPMQSYGFPTFNKVIVPPLQTHPHQQQMPWTVPSSMQQSSHTPSSLQTRSIMSLLESNMQPLSSITTENASTSTQSNVFSESPTEVDVSTLISSSDSEYRRLASFPIKFESTEYVETMPKANAFGVPGEPIQRIPRSSQSDQEFLPYSSGSTFSNHISLSQLQPPNSISNALQLQPSSNPSLGSPNDLSLLNLNQPQLSDQYSLQNSNPSSISNTRIQQSSCYQAQDSNISECAVSTSQQQNRLQPPPINNSQVVYYQDSTNGQIYRMNVPMHAQNSTYQHYQPQPSFSPNQWPGLGAINNTHCGQQIHHGLSLTSQKSTVESNLQQLPHQIHYHQQQITPTHLNQQQPPQTHLQQQQPTHTHLQQLLTHTHLQQLQSQQAHLQQLQSSQAHLQQQQSSQSHLQQLQPTQTHLQQINSQIHLNPQTSSQNNIPSSLPSEMQISQRQQPLQISDQFQMTQQQQSQSQIQVSNQHHQPFMPVFDQDLAILQQQPHVNVSQQQSSIPSFRQQSQSQIHYHQLQNHRIKSQPQVQGSSHIPINQIPPQNCSQILQKSRQDSNPAPAFNAMSSSCNERNPSFIANTYPPTQSHAIELNERTGLAPPGEILQTPSNLISPNQPYQMIQMPDGTTYIVVQPQPGNSANILPLKNLNSQASNECIAGTAQQHQNTADITTFVPGSSNGSHQSLISKCSSNVGNMNFGVNEDQNFICNSNSTQAQPCPCPRCSLRVAANTVADKYRKVLPFPGPVESKSRPQQIETALSFVKTYVSRNPNKSVKRQLASMLMEKQINSNAEKTSEASEGAETLIATSETPGSVQVSRKNPVLTAVVRPMEHPLQKMSDQISQIEFSFNASLPMPSAVPIIGQILAAETSMSSRKDSQENINDNTLGQDNTIPVNIPVTYCASVAGTSNSGSNSVPTNICQDATSIPTPESPISLTSSSDINPPTTPTRVGVKRKLEQVADGSPAKSIKVTLRRKEGGDSYSIKDVSETGAGSTGAMRSLKIKGKITSGEFAGTSTDVVVEPRIHIVPIPNPDSEELDSNLTIAAADSPIGPIVPNIPVRENCDDLSDKNPSMRLTHRAVVVYEVKDSSTVLFRSSDVRAVWSHIFETVQGTRLNHNLPPLSYPATNISLSENQREPTTTFNMLGLTHRAVQFLLHHLPKKKSEAEKHKIRLLEPPTTAKDEDDIEINESGCGRTEGYIGRKPFDMFGWLASKHRKPLETIQNSEEGLKNNGIYIALRFRNLKEKTEKTLMVLWSTIHGRGLYTRRLIEKGEMVIEYAGEVIRSLVCDQREKYYETKGIGCYMFRINDESVIDATMKGNAARFINHSCDPNCESKSIKILGKEHILIFSLRKISSGEELTYDYKFDKEEVKIPCSCASKKCRKYLN